MACQFDRSFGCSDQVFLFQIQSAFCFKQSQTSTLKLLFMLKSHGVVVRDNSKLCFYHYLQYRHLIPAPVNRTSASAWLHKHPWITCQKIKPSTSLTVVACATKLRSVVRSSMHPCPGNWVAIGRAVVYYAQAAHAFSAGIKCWHI